MNFYKVHQKLNLSLTRVCTSAFILITIISSPVIAQQEAFSIADKVNPLKDFVIPSNRESHPFFVDIDGDGDLDCFSGEYTNSAISRVYFYRNNGTNNKAEFKLTTGADNPLNNLTANMLSIPYFIDIDGDGDYDCFVGEGTTGAIMFYKNVGSATHPDLQKQSAAFNPLSMVKFSTSNVASPAFADVDGDGDYDCLIADEAGELNYYENIGSATKPVFAHIDNEENPFAALSAQGGVYNVSFVDWNKDGLMDLFVNTTYYKNVGTRHRPKFSIDTENQPVFQNTSSYKYTYTPLRWVDLNGDGNVEVFQGSSAGKFTYQTLTPKDGKVGAIANTTSVRITPNPSKYEFTLNITPAVPSVIRVVDAQGKLLSTHITGGSTVKFGAELIPGVYFLQVMQNNKVVYNQKLIKE